MQQLRGLYFDYHAVVDDHVQALGPDWHASVVDPDGDFATDAMAASQQFLLERSLIDVLQEAVSELIVDGVEGTDDGFGDPLVAKGFVRGHRPKWSPSSRARHHFHACLIKRFH